MRYKNNIGPQVGRRRYVLGWSQSVLAAKLQIDGFDTSRSGVSKIEARLSYMDNKTLPYLAEVLKIPVQDLFPARTGSNPPPRIHREAGDHAILMRTLKRDPSNEVRPTQTRLSPDHI